MEALWRESGRFWAEAIGGAGASIRAAGHRMTYRRVPKTAVQYKKTLLLPMLLWQGIPAHSGRLRHFRCFPAAERF